MNTMTIDLQLFEALTEIGIKPDSAKRVERQVELAIAQGHKAIRDEIREQQAGLMSKHDGLELKAELKQDIAEVRREISDVRQEISEAKADFSKAMNDQTWKLIVAVMAINGLTLAGFKLLG